MSILFVIDSKLDVLLEIHLITLGFLMNARASFLAVLLVSTVIPIVSAHSETRVWNRVSDGVWSDPAAWLPPGVPVMGDDVVITNGGTYKVTLSSNVTLNSLVLGGSSGAQTLAIAQGTTTLTEGIVLRNGVLTLAAASVRGKLWVEPDGELRFEGSQGNTSLYMLSLLNEGVCRWLAGAITCTGSTITNRGDWLIEKADFGNCQGDAARFVNEGTLRKTGSSAENHFVIENFVNQGLVVVEQGSLVFRGGAPTALGGRFRVERNCAVSLRDQLKDDGAVFEGEGASRMLSGTLTLERDVLKGLELAGGEVRLGSDFQAGGAITNLTLNGATLGGTNTVGAGQLTLAGAHVPGALKISSAGQLVLGEGGINFASATVVNEGKVSLEGLGDKHFTGTTVVSNRGEWIISVSSTLYGSETPVFVNSGLLHKKGDPGRTTFYGLPVVNHGVICAEDGVLDFTLPLTNEGGTLRLLGGQIGQYSPVWLSGGRLEGTGSIGPFVGDAGTIAPGLNGEGTITFLSNLYISNAVVVEMAAKATGTSWVCGHLVANNAVSLDDCSLALGALPMMPVGAELTIIEHGGNAASGGSFQGIANGGLFTSSGQLFRVFYDRGSGNDVVLVRDNGGVTLEIQRTGLPGTCWIQGRGTNYATYVILSATNLSAPVWEQVAAVPADGGGLFGWLDVRSTNEPARFFRSLGP